MALKPPPLDKGDRIDNIPRTVQATDTPAARSDKTRVDFRTEKFVDAIKQKGYHLIWRKAMLCTCKSPETDQARLACTNCDGSGYFYIDETEIQGLMTNLKRRTDVYQKPGEWSTVEANLTVEPQYRLGYRDQVEMRDSVMVFNEWIIKGDRTGIRNKLPEGMDSARYRIEAVNAAMFVMNACEPVRLECGTDFRLTDEGWIQWLAPGNAKVNDGQPISLHYEFHPIWVVTSHPHTIRDTIRLFKRDKPTVEALPLQAEVTLDFILDVNR